MGRRGPIPKPGSFDTQVGRNTYHRKSPAPPAVPVEPPAVVQADAVALAFWNRHADTLIASHRLRPEQADAFGVLACLYSDIVVLMATVQASGAVIDTQKGPMPHPAAKMLRDARRDFVALSRDFGMTAASEARIPREGSDGEEAGEDAELRAFTG